MPIHDFAKGIGCRNGYRHICILCLKKLRNQGAKKRRRKNWKGQGGHNKYKCPLLKSIMRRLSQWDYAEKLGHTNVSENSLTKRIQIRRRKKHGKLIPTQEKIKAYQKTHKDKNPILYNQKRANYLRKGRCELPDWYIRIVLKKTGIPNDMNEIIELKREQIKLTRKIHEKARNAANIK